MQIILKSRTQFFQRQTISDKDGNESSKVLNTVTLAPSALPQNAPDWITSDPLFALMLRDGSLVQVAEQPAAQSDPPAAGKPTVARDAD